MLDQEIRTYETHKGDLLEVAEGRFVLIHGDVVAGIFEDRMAAISYGFRRFGYVPILTRRIERFQRVVSILRSVSPSRRSRIATVSAT